MYSVGGKLLRRVLWVCQEASEVPSSVVVNVKDILEADSLLTPDQLHQLENAVCSSQLTDVRQVVGELTRRFEAGERSENLMARGGVGAYLLARQTSADKMLSGVTRDGIAMFIHGQCLTSLNRPVEAAERFDQAGKAGFDPVGCALRRAGAIRASGKIDDAEKLLRSVAASAVLS